MHFPEMSNDLSYIAKRASKFLFWERLKHVKLDTKKHDIKLNSRTIFDLRQPIHKKASVLVESYDLHTVSCHPDLRGKPEKIESFLYTLYDFHTFVRTKSKRCIIIEETVRNNMLMVSLETDCNLLLEYSNISKISNVVTFDTVSRGEQIRVFNKLLDFTKDDFFINSAELAKGPVRYSILERPPTFMDPLEPEITTLLREDCLKKLEECKLQSKDVIKKKQVKNVLGSFKKRKTLDPNEEIDESSEEEIQEEDANTCEGGNVCKPAPNFWGNLKILLLDFASLYPSIMRAFNISYENIITNHKYMDIAGVKYIFVPINAHETVAIVDEKGVFGALLTLLVSERSKVKKLMAKSSGFEYKNYNKQQESLKVICNATYGFCGAEDNGSILALKSVMYIVTSIGRYLQKTAAKFLADKYGMPSIYGDTDSVFASPGYMNPSKSEMPDFTAKMGLKYGMTGCFMEQFGEDFKTGFTWENVINYYRLPKFKLDLTVMSEEIMCNAVLFLVYKKLASEISEEFRTEIVMEFENMIDNLFMGWVKKHYFGRKWNPDKPHIPESSLKIIGMASKKRDWILYTRIVLKQITDYLASNKIELIPEYILKSMQRFTSQDIPLEQLKISCKYKGKLHYKSYNFKQMQIVLKMEKRHRCEVQEKSRVSFVIIKSPQNLYLRAETIEYVKKHNIQIDWEYYFVKQFYKPVKKLLTFHPTLMDFNKAYNDVLTIMKKKNNNMVDLKNISSSKKLCIENLLQRKVIPKKVVVKKNPILSKFKSVQTL
jgi:DNA polymerase elongation subunit (family B)